MDQHVKEIRTARRPFLKRLAAAPLVSAWMPLGADVRSRNMRNVLIDGIGVGFASAATPFLPVFLARLGGSDFAVGLLTAMPALAGFIFALPVGRFLSRQRFVVPWFSAARLFVISSYALTALVPFFTADRQVEAIILIWALATLPQTVVSVAFTVVMANVAGPEGRYYLMSRRWSILGFTTAVTVALAGFALNAIQFPYGYQVVFFALSLGGLVSYYFSTHIVLPPQPPPPPARAALPLRTRLREWVSTLRKQSRFVRFTACQFVYRFGFAWALPLFPLFYVHNLKADDAAIGLINTVQSGVLLVAYFMWARITRRRGVRFALLATTGAVALYPILLSLTTQVEIVLLLSGLAGIFAAGIDLVFFDMLVSSFPPESSAMFVGVNQMTVYIANFIGPLAGTALAQEIGIPGSLVASGVFRLIGFGLFAYLVRE